MDFIFQGFQSSLPVWVYLLIFTGTSLLAWWSYRTVTGIKPFYRYLLMILRTATFFVLILLLVNPFVKTETTYLEAPSIAVLFDNTASTAIQKNTYRGEESYREVIDQLNFEDSANVHYNFFAFGNEVASTKPGRLNLDADQTNLYNPIQQIGALQQETDAAVLLSDGIFTKGQNPSFATENISIPVFTIGLGDTTYQKDILVRSVSTNNTGFLNSKQPVTTTIVSRGFQGRSFPVELRRGKEVIDRKTITPDIANSSTELTFELSLDEERLQQFQISVPKLEDEWTEANNTQLFSVDVQDARQQILSLAFEVHPDVKFVRSLLLSDKNTELISRTWLRGDRFIEGNFDFDPDTLDLAILHGFPSSGLPSGLQSKLKSLAQDVPLIIVATPLFNPAAFEQSITSLPVAATGRWSYQSVSLSPVPESATHPIMELPSISSDQIPPLKAPIENISAAPGSITLYNSMFQGQPTQAPIISVQELGNKRLAMVSGFGWYKLNQQNDPALRDFTTQLWLNMVSWTAADPENQLLEVQPSQTSFTGSESVVIDAYLKNERGELESNGTVDISIASDSMDSRFYSMENLGSGHYRLNLDTMPEGLYQFEATAKKENREIESQTGEFSVARSNAEYVNTTRNDALLRRLADRTGGKFVPYDSVSGFWNRLEERGLLEAKEKVRSHFFYPYQSAIWFIVVLLFLCCEWILRKYLSLP